MKLLKTCLLTLSIGALSAVAFVADAQNKPAGTADKKAAASAATGDMVDGEVRKVDKDTRKITLKHGDIKNLDMPGMTMVFQVKDPGMLDQLKEGDKVRFKAEKAGGSIVVTELQVSK